MITKDVFQKVHSDWKKYLKSATDFINYMKMKACDYDMSHSST